MVSYTEKISIKLQLLKQLVSYIKLNPTILVTDCLHLYIYFLHNKII